MDDDDDDDDDDEDAQWLIVINGYYRLSCNGKAWGADGSESQIIIRYI